MEEIILSKKCRRCGEDKLLTDYRRNRSEKDGRERYCKICASEIVNRSQLKKLESDKKRYFEGSHYKTCKICGDLPFTPEFWYLHLGGCKCRRCHAVKGRAYREENRPIILAQKKKYYELHKETIKVANARWLATQPTYYERDRSRRRRAEDPEYERAACRLYRKKYREKIRLSRAAYRKENLAKTRERSRLSQRISTANISDRYCVDKLKRNGLVEEITPEIIELKRQQLLTHRTIKKLKEELRNGTYSEGDRGTAGDHQEPTMAGAETESR